MRFKSPGGLPLLPLLLPLLIWSCGEEPSNGHIHNICDNSTDTVPFETGMVLTSQDGALQLTVVTTEPNPIDRGDNTWTVALRDAAGDPVSGASVVLEPTMPGHGHGTFPATFDGTPTEEPGHFLIGPFNLMMPGTWLLTFTVIPVDGEQGIIESGYCLES